MGTRFELVLAVEDEVDARAVGDEAIREIELWHTRLSRFEPSSDVARLNREGGGRVDPELFGLLELCEEVRAASGGAFDVGVGRMMEELGFHPTGPEGRRARQPEDPARSAQRMVLDAEGMTVAPGSDASLDLGAVAKGFALDRAAAILIEHGVDRALLHGGTSSIVAIGEWPIAVRSDRESLNVRLRDQAFSVSAPRGRTVRAVRSAAEPADIGRDADATHILDPRTGRPAAALDTAAVIGPIGRAAMCDAWSTAMIVLGDRPPTMPAELSTHLHAPATGWRSHTARPIPC